MIEISFDYDEKSDWLIPRPNDSKYKAIELIGNRGWTSDRVAEDIEWTTRCKGGDFESEDGEVDFYVGFEGSPGIIYVRNEDRAYVEDAYETEKDDYLILSHDELLGVLRQMYDYLISIGK